MQESAPSSKKKSENWIERSYINATRNLVQWEKDKYLGLVKSVVTLRGRPPYPLGVLFDSRWEGLKLVEHDKMVAATLLYYSSRPRSELLNVLKFCIVNYTARMRAEADIHEATKVFYRAVECCRSIIQYSPSCINAEAEDFIYRISTEMVGMSPGKTSASSTVGDFRAKEISVHSAMRRVCEKPRDLSLRIELANAYYKQGSIYDSLTQYNYVSQMFKNSQSNLSTHKNIISLRIAEIYQNIADFIAFNKSNIEDGGKISSFASRFNRDLGSKIPLVETTNSASLTKIQDSLYNIVGKIYAEALDSGATQNTTTLLHIAKTHASNLKIKKQYKKATEVLWRSYGLWKKEVASPTTNVLRLEYAELLAGCARRAGMQSISTKINPDIEELNRLVPKRKDASGVGFTAR